MIAGLALLAAAAPAAARAAGFEVTSFSVTPSTTAAGAHAEVTIAASFTPYALGDPPERRTRASAASRSTRPR